MSKKLLQKAIDYAGSQTALADGIGVDQTTVSAWLVKRNGEVPPQKAVAIEHFTQGFVSRQELRPDIFNIQKHNQGHDGVAAP